MIAPEAKIPVLKIPQVFDKQSTGAQEQNRKGDLDRDQAFSKPALKPRFVRTSGLAQRGYWSDADSVQGGSQAKDKSSQYCNSRGKSKHVKVRLNAKMDLFVKASASED